MTSEQSVKISIITVVYNGGDTIEQTINSVITQTYDNIEYIIIDGDSTDNTKEIIQKYKNNVNIFISEKDQGLYYAMNKGVLLASGEIIGIINSDDLYTDTAVSRVVEYYKTYHADVIYGDAVWFDDSEKTSPYRCQDIEELWYRMALPHPAVFIKKELYKKYGLFDTKYSIAADYDLILRLYCRGAAFGYVNQDLAYFRRGGMSARKQVKCIQEAREISLSYINQCKDKEKWLPKIQEQYVKGMFIQLLEEKQEILVKDIKQILYEKNKASHIVIWGAGTYGELCLQLLEKTDICIDFFVDQAPSKYGKKFVDKTIKRPEKLAAYKGCILIATFKYEDEIKQQLEKIDSRLTSISLLDWARRSVDVWENRQEAD